HADRARPAGGRAVPGAAGAAPAGGGRACFGRRRGRGSRGGGRQPGGGAGRAGDRLRPAPAGHARPRGAEGVPRAGRADPGGGGAAAAVFLSAEVGQLDRLAAREVVRGETVRPLAGNTLAAIGPRGLAAVRRPADLLGAGVKRVALASASCPLGGYTRAYLEE